MRKNIKLSLYMVVLAVLLVSCSAKDRGECKNEVKTEYIIEKIKSVSSSFSVTSCIFETDKGDILMSSGCYNKKSGDKIVEIQYYNLDCSKSHTGIRYV